MGREFGGGAEPLVEQRARYVRLMQQGWTNADACREVGVHRRTGGRWRNGRAVKVPGGEARIYLPIPSGPVPVESGRYLTQDERIVIADGIRAALLPAVADDCAPLSRRQFFHAHGIIDPYVPRVVNSRLKRTGLDIL